MNWRKQIKPMFFDEQGEPRWNKLYTKEGVAKEAGFTIPEDRNERDRFFKKLCTALSRLRDSDNHRFPFVTKDSRYTFLNSYKAFISVRIRPFSKQIYGFTTNPRVIAAVMKDMIVMCNSNLMRGDNHLKWLRQLATESESPWREKLVERIPEFEAMLESGRETGQRMLREYAKLIATLKGSKA